MEEMRVKSLLSGGGQGSSCEKKDLFLFLAWLFKERHSLQETPPPFTDSLALSSYPAFFGLSPSLPRGTWLTAKTAGSLGSAWCSIWFVLFGTMKVKMLSVTESL